MTEEEHQAQVIALAKLCGWLAYHTHDSRKSAAGFPDLVLVRPPRLIFAELKSEKGQLTMEQAQWLAKLKDCGQHAFLWRPRDWPAIEAALR